MSKFSAKLPLNFTTNKPLDVKFSGLDLSSNAGLLLAKQAETNIKICEGFANCLLDKRQQQKVQHSLPQLISQRIYQILAGYKDTIDSNYLRHDPIFKIICDKVPTPGEEFLASQPTISRLENQITNKELSKIRSFFVDKFIESHRGNPGLIILDIDGWDALTHGHQQLSLFNGYYGHNVYYPFLLNEAISGYPLLLELRPGNSHPGKGVVGLLRWLFWRFKKAWPGVQIVLRGDGGFSLPEIINLCERSDVIYTLGFSSNAVLKRKIDYLLDVARLQYFRTGKKARLFDDVYYKAQSWKNPRRLIMKGEWLDTGPNPRFLITNSDMDASELYDNFYVKRGATSEGRIKELKLGLNADRLSCHTFDANQFRLFLSQAAYILMLEIRASAQNTSFAKSTVSSLQQKIFKIAAKVTVSVRRIRVELPFHCPMIDDITVIAQQLCSGKQLIFD